MNKKILVVLHSSKKVSQEVFNQISDMVKHFNSEFMTRHEIRFEVSNSKVDGFSAGSMCTRLSVYHTTESEMFFLDDDGWVLFQNTVRRALQVFHPEYSKAGAIMRWEESLHFNLTEDQISYSRPWGT